MLFNERLRQLRANANVKQTEVASYIGISPSAYSMYEQGVREPTMETLKKLADYFDCSTDYLLGKQGHKKFSDQSIEFLSNLDIADDEAIKKVRLYYNGTKLNEEEVLQFIQMSRVLFGKKN